MKISDYRDPEDALEPVADAVEQALRDELFLGASLPLFKREKTGDAPEMEISFDSSVTVYAYVTIESDASVSFTVGWRAMVREGDGDQEMQNVSKDTDIADALEWVVRQADDYACIETCRGCGRRMKREGFCSDCDSAALEDARANEWDNRRKDGEF